MRFCLSAYRILSGCSRLAFLFICLPHPERMLTDRN
nr:MAG TPA: hypothetical protein [Microviridae sp.]